MGTNEQPSIESAVEFEDTPLYEDELEDEYDPLEPYNRLMFRMNDAIDKVFVTPIAMTYKYILPKFLQIGIKNFTTNFFSPAKAINFVLQKDGEYAAKTVFRFIVNSLFGFFGTADVAKQIGLEGKDTSFGDTLKKWGAKPGPFVVLPFFGGTSMRGAASSVIGFPINYAAELSLARYKRNTKNRLYYVIYGADLVVRRASVLTLMQEMEKTSNDMYVTIRKAVMALERA